MLDAFDVIVVGAGSSGGVAAARLSEDPAVRVALIEAAPDFPDEAEQLPLFAVSGENHWQVPAVPEFDWRLFDHDRGGRRGGRKLWLPRGRLVGGTSMVNSTIAARPAPSDLDHFADLAGPAWGWDNRLPDLIRIERDLDFGDDPIHGSEGPIAIQRYKPESWAPVNRVFAEGCAVLGIREAKDLNGLDASAGVFGAIPHNRHKEVRQGTLVTYLRAARRRPNLTILPQRLVDRVMIEHGRAVGVNWIGADGQPGQSRANTVVLSAGVFMSPAILQRSGVGPSALLARHGIPVAADLPVGLNLTDHPGVPFTFRIDGAAGTTGRFFAANWRGPEMDGPEPWWQTHPFPVDEDEGICGLWTYLCRQDSRGTVEIAGSDPAEPPLIDLCHLSAPRDIDKFADAWAANQALLATAPFTRHGARWLEPDLDLTSHVRANIGTAHHQSGTCRMGRDPASSVVGPDLHVHGIEGLMVADASAFPATILHNLNLTAYMFGEVAAQVIAQS